MIEFLRKFHEHYFKTRYLLFVREERYWLTLVTCYYCCCLRKCDFEIRDPTMKGSNRYPCEKKINRSVKYQISNDALLCLARFLCLLPRELRACNIQFFVIILKITKMYTSIVCLFWNEYNKISRGTVLWT